MKKIFTICAALMAAMTMSAEVTNMTCAEAANAAALLEHNTPGKDSVAVTGYVTSTDGKISNGQQSFWMDDEKGSKRTFNSYWGNMPEGESALNVGDKVVLKGLLMRYNETYQIKNGEITILDRADVSFDTIPASVCEAIEECEALADKDNTQDYFEINGLVTSTDKTNDNYHTQTFYFTCDDNNKQLQGYNITMKGDYAVVGDSVHVIGRLVKFGTTLEITGDGEVTKKGGVVIETIEVNVAEALAAAQALANNEVSKDIYVISGYVSEIKDAYSEQYKNISFYMCDDMANPAKDFVVYRAKGGETLKAGDKVVVTGNLKNHYYAESDEHSYQTNTGATIEIVTEEGVENTRVEGAAIKVIENGQLVIIRNDVRYNAAGVVME